MRLSRAVLRVWAELGQCRIVTSCHVRWHVSRRIWWCTWWGAGRWVRSTCSRETSQSGNSNCNTCYKLSCLLVSISTVSTLFRMLLLEVNKLCCFLSFPYFHFLLLTHQHRAAQDWPTGQNTKSNKLWQVAIMPSKFWPAVTKLRPQTTFFSPGLRIWVWFLDVYSAFHSKYWRLNWSKEFNTTLWNGNLHLINLQHLQEKYSTFAFIQ